MAYNSIASATGNVGTRLVILGAVTVAAFVMTVYAAVNGMAMFTPFFFYIPIIIASSWYPRRGVLFAVVLGFIQLLLVYLFIRPDIYFLTYATATASFYVLVATAVVIASLAAGLRDQEAKYHAIFDHSEAAVFLLSDDPGLQIFEVNRRGRELTGYPPGILEKSSFLRVAREDAIEMWFAKLRDDGTASEHESLFATREGRKFPVILSAARLPGGQIVCIAMDISARKRAEEEIARKNRELSVINQVISMTGAARTVPNLIEESLSRTCDLLRFQAGMVYLINPGRNLIELQFHRGNQKSGVVTFYERDRYPYPEVFRGIPVYPGGGSEVPAAVIPLVCDREVIGSMHLFTVQDRTLTAEEKTIIESVGKEVGCAIRKLTLSEKLAVSNQRANLYLDILVHDINNANMTSLGYGQLVSDMIEGKAEEIMEKMLDVIKKSGEIIRNLETIRKIHEKMPELSAVDLDQVIRSELQLFHDYEHFEYAPSALRVYGDELLPVIFANLFGNSVKFGGKDVTISCRAREEFNEVMVSVEDNGPGIPDAMKPLIFDRFQQGTTRRTGKGLGLYIVKALVDRYGGRIWVEDRVPGDYTQGVAFRFTLKKFLG